MIVKKKQKLNVKKIKLAVKVSMLSEGSKNVIDTTLAGNPSPSVHVRLFLIVYPLPSCPGVCALHTPIRLQSDPEDSRALHPGADPPHLGGAASTL